ncbi:hypothetical protein [Thalassobacillus hwangdonensis]|uniref:Sporulation protein n=1 Tax=Thalassobacillus hwangdonensis TaxID=546108 RepID=A0ABW3L3L4_9BACI
MKKWALALALLSFSVLAACNNMEDYQGQNEDPNPTAEEMKFTDTKPSGIDNPRTINNVGRTWGLKQDRDKIIESAESVPGVKVERVILESGFVRVTASIDEKDLSEADKKDWAKQIEETIEGAMPRYDIKVKVR